ncbi:MAG: HAD family hydrolase [bacterium]|nr:HAD family hydrolase [bacterium]
MHKKTRAMDLTKTSFGKIDLENVKGVLLDLDNTLYKHEPCHQAGLKSCWNHFRKSLNINYPADKLNEFYQKGRVAVQKRLFPQGICRSRLLYFQAMLEEMSVPKAFAKAINLETVYIDSFLKSMEIDTNSLMFLKRCKKLNIPVCIISNLTTQFQIKKIMTLNIQDLVSFLVTSEEAGIEKPDKTIFELSLYKLSLPHEEVVMIGDSISHDIEGAKSIGIKHYLVDIT